MLTRSAAIGCGTLAWDDVGSGPCVLLIHGFPLRRALWRPQVTALTAAGYRVVAPDLPGFGDSDACADSATIDRYADHLIELLDHLAIDQVAGVGMSMGGYVLFNLLERYSRRFSAAVFAVTRCLPDDETGRQRRYQLVQAAQQQGPQAVADPFLDILIPPELRDSRPRLAEEVYGWMVGTSTVGLASGLLAMAARTDATPLLATIGVPTLVIGAEEDRAIPPEHSSMIAGGITNSRLVVIPEAGHLVNLERPGEFNRALLEFLRDTVPTPLNTDAVLCSC